jgi:succinoglycan biosynthesis transport protein ExoP
MVPGQNYLTVSRRPPDVEDYIDMLRRYRSWVIGPTFAGLVISVLVACWWPDTYISSAVMRIMPQSVPTNLVPSAVTGQMQERLGQMQVQILGRSELMALIQKPSLDLYKKDRAHLPLEDIAETMRTKAIHIRLYDAPGAAQNRIGATAFMISFAYTDRYKAQQVVRELTSKFEETNFRLQQTSATQTATFLTDELKRDKDRMDAKDAEIAQFTAENQGRLPENFQANMMQVNSIETQIASAEDQIGRDQAQKLTLETTLQNLKNQEVAATNSVERTTTTQGAAVKNDRLMELNKVILGAKANLAAAQQRYRDDMPEIKVFKDQIRQFEAERSQLEKEDQLAQTNQQTVQARVVTDPQVQAHILDLQAQEQNTKTAIGNLQAEIESKNKRRGELEKELQNVQSRIAASPSAIQKYNALLQDLALAKDEYQQTSKKRALSETAQNLEEHKAGESLELLEAADLPETPSEPNRMLIMAMGTFAGLCLGFAMAGAKELKNTSLKNLKDVRAYTNLPVLSSIPLLENALLVRRKRRLAWLAWSSAVIIGGILMCGAAYYHLTAGQVPS